MRRYVLPNSFWTDHRIEELKRLCLDGKSALEIALEIGAPSRNAVIGKVHRLGLRLTGQKGTQRRAYDAEELRRLAPKLSSVELGQALGVSRRTAKEYARAAGVSIESQRSRDIKVNRPKPPEPIMVSVASVLESCPVTIVDLRDGVCRWPLFDDARTTCPREAMYCGADCSTDRAYCTVHADLARGREFTKAERKDFAAERRMARPTVQGVSRHIVDTM